MSSIIQAAGPGERLGSLIQLKMSEVLPQPS